MRVYIALCAALLILALHEASEKLASLVLAVLLALQWLRLRTIEREQEQQRKQLSALQIALRTAQRALQTATSQAGAAALGEGAAARHAAAEPAPAGLTEQPQTGQTPAPAAAASAAGSRVDMRTADDMRATGDTRAAASAPAHDAQAAAPSPSSSTRPETIARADTIARPAAAARPVSSTARSSPAPVVDSQPGPLRWLLAGNPLAKVGVLLLFFGLAYLFRYAAEHALLPIEIRLGGGLLLAFGLLGIGWRLRERMPLYGLLLQGAATGCMYLIIFAAFRLYQLLPHTLAFGLMLVICAASVVLAVLQRAQGLAMAASLGGFMAPLLLSTGSGDHVGLFSYYLLLSSGILAVSLFQSWRPLNVIGFIFTFGVAGLWGARSYHPGLYWECQLFLLAFLAIYGSVALLFARRQPLEMRGFVDGTLVFGAPLVGFGLQYGLTRHWDMGPAFSAMAFAAVYLPLAWLLLRRHAEHMRLLAHSFLALGLAFVTLAIPLGLNASWTALAWVLEGAGLIWVGSAQAQRRMVLSGVALQVLAGMAWAGFMARDPSLIAGTTSGSVLALAALAGAALLWRARDEAGENLALSRLLLVGGLAVWLFTLPWLLDHLPTPLQTPNFASAWLLLLSASALIWHVGGRRLDWPEPGHAAWLLWPLALLCLGELQHPLMAWTWLAWPLTLAVGLWLLRQREEDTHELLLIALHASWIWGAAAILILEAGWQLNYPMADEWLSLAWLLLPAAIVGAVLTVVRRDLWPAATQPLAWRVLGPAPLLLLLAVQLLHANLADGRVAPLSVYIPMLNPLELAAAAAVLAVVSWYRQASGHYAALQLPATLAVAIMAALAFWWGNGMLLRLLAQLLELPWTFTDLWQSRIIQATLALVWTACAMTLMWQATRHGRRQQWMAGAALLAVVLGKLMLVDAAGGGLARAAAFIGVALLLLLTGYLAPLPPRRADDDAEADTHERMRGGHHG